MADIVITVPDEVIRNKTYADYFGCMSSKLGEILHNAIKLPQGHGELKDMGNLKYIFYLDRDEPVYSGKDIKMAIDSMKTLVEADKSEIDARQQMLINHLKTGEEKTDNTSFNIPVNYLNASKGKEFVLTEKGYKKTPNKVKSEREIGQPVKGYEESVPKSWVSNGWVEEKDKEPDTRDETEFER